MEQDEIEYVADIINESTLIKDQTVINSVKKCCDIKYYVYQHRRLDTNEIFYVGLGKEDGGKFLRSKAKRAGKRTEFWKNITNKTPYKIEIVCTDLTKEEACSKERELIALYGRRDLNLGTLVNMTDGGETTPNLSVETKLRISHSLKGRKLSEETKNKLRESVTKTWNSPEYAEQRRVQSVRSKHYHELGVISMKGKPSPKKGKPFAGDKQKLSESLKRYWSDQERRDLEALAKGGKVFNVFKAKHPIPGKRAVIKGDLLFKSCNKAYCAEKLGLERGHIRRCLKGELKQVKGYIFEYEN